MMLRKRDHSTEVCCLNFLSLKNEISVGKGEGAITGFRKLRVFLMGGESDTSVRFDGRLSSRLAGRTASCFSRRVEGVVSKTCSLCGLEFTVLTGM